MARHLAGGLILALAPAIPGVAAGKIVIEHMHDSAHADPWYQWLQLAKSRFEAQNPDVEISILVMGRTELLEKAATLYAAGKLPDVIELAPELGIHLAEQGMLLDLNPYMAAERGLRWEEFFPLAVQGVTLPPGSSKPGMRWILPGSIWVVGAGFNVDFFNEAGLVPPAGSDSQWTWEDFLRMGQKLTRVRSDGTVERYAAEVSRSWNRWPLWVHNAGGWMFDRYILPTRAQLTTEPVRTAVRFLFDIYHTYRIASWSGSQASFLDGKSAIGLSVGPSHTSLYRQAGHTYAYAFGPNPSLVRGGSEIQILGWALGAQSKNPQMAWKWIKFLATEMANDHVSLTGRPPAWIRAARRYQAALKDASPWEYVWIDLISRPDSYARGVYDAQVRDTMQSYINQILDRKAALEPTLEAADQALNALLRERQAAEAARR